MTENKRKYYIEQFHKIYKFAETEESFIKKISELVNANIDIEMKNCSFILTKEQYDIFRINLYMCEMKNINKLTKEFLNEYKRRI